MSFEDEPNRRKPGRHPERRARNPLEKARDAREISRLRLRYALWSHQDITDALNSKFYRDRERGEDGREPPLLSRQMISYEIKRLEARLDAEATNDTLKLRRLRIAELRELEEFCRERFEATVGTHTITRETEGGEKDGSKQTTTEELSGERGYLELAFKCKQEITELENLYPPRKIAPTNPDGTKPFSAFGDEEELKRLGALFEKITGKKPK